MNNKKIPVVQTKGVFLKKVRGFSVWHLAVFILVFGVIGYVIYHSFAATTTTTSATGTYASPFGDLSCLKTINGTSTITSGCACNPQVSTCIGSCVKSTVSVYNATTNPSGGCRPMTMEYCDGDPPTNSLQPQALDQGVDYTVIKAGTNCTYNNPNAADTGGLTARNARINTRVYAMGSGTITCVAANPGFDEPLTISQKCRGGSVQIGQGEGTWLVYKLTASGAAHGLKIYIAEGCNLSRNAINDATAGGNTGNSPGKLHLGRRWKVNDQVTRNSVLCEVHNGNPPGNPGTIEMGWANEGTQIGASGYRLKNDIVPAAYTCFHRGLNDPNSSVVSNYIPTVWGLSFNNFVKTYGSLPGGISGDTNTAKINGSNAYYTKIGSCPKYPMPAKYAKSAWNYNQRG